MMKVFERNRLKGELTDELYEKWNRCREPDIKFLRAYSEEEKRNNEGWMGEQLSRFEEQLDSFPRLKSKRREWYAEVEMLAVTAALSDPVAGLGKTFGEETLADFIGQIKVFLQKLEHFDSQISLNDIGQAMRNYLVYGVFREMNELPQLCTSAIFGYSMLYPYTDNFLDEGKNSKEEKARYNQLIADKIRGLPIHLRSASLHEKRTMKLLNEIEECYPRTEEQDLYEGLLYMLEAQADSQKQYGGETTSEEEIFKISVYKGGLSVLIDRYLIQKPLTEEDLRFYYGFGFLLQLCDDLQDITEDKNEGSSTLFSICNDKEEMDQTLDRLLAFTRELFYDCTAANTKLRDFMRHCCFLLILISAEGSGIHLSSEKREWLAEYLPFTPEFLEEIRSRFQNTTGQRRGSGKEAKLKKLLFGFGTYKK